jgi:hypothetical protein
LTPATAIGHATSMLLAEGERSPGGGAPGVQGGGGGRGVADAYPRLVRDVACAASSSCRIQRMNRALSPSLRGALATKQSSPLRTPILVSNSERLDIVIVSASEAIHRAAKRKNWIASSQGLLAMTVSCLAPRRANQKACLPSSLSSCSGRFRPCPSATCSGRLPCHSSSS